MSELFVKKYNSRTPKSKKHHKEAEKFAPGGIQSLIRCFPPHPFIIAKGEGSKIWDIDDNEYIDYCMSYGPLIAGHSHPKIVKAITEQAKKGTLYGAPHEKTTLFIKELLKRFPTMDKFCLTNSGAEANAHVSRVARAYTGRDKIMKVEGCYHGASDYLEISVGPPIEEAGPVEAPRIYKESEGIPDDASKNTVVVPYNDPYIVEQMFRKHEDEISMLILEPILLNSGCILPKKNYLRDLRKITRENDALLVFDEVKTGCRIGPGSVSEIYKVKPDMVVLGKAIGGGLPLAAFGGTKKIMEKIAPIGKVRHSGTYFGNPLSVAAGLTCLRDIMNRRAYAYMNRLGKELLDGVKDVVSDSGVKATVSGIGSVGIIFFNDALPVDYRSAVISDQELWYKYWISMINEGVLISGNTWHQTWFVSVAHTNEDITRTINAVQTVLSTLPKKS